MRRGIVTVLLCADLVVTAAIATCTIDLSQAIQRSGAAARVAHAVLFTGKRLALAGRVFIRGA